LQYNILITINISHT